MHMLHHLSFGVADLDRSVAFYDAVFAPLGYVRVWADATAAGHGGKDLGDGARLHSEYGPDYSAAYVPDPDGHRLEAVIVGPV